MPGSTWLPLPENKTQRPIHPTQVIVHTAVDAPGETRLDRYFRKAGIGAESTFYIPFDGEIVQMMSTEIEADANRAADTRAISIETEDDGDPERNPWTVDQVGALVQVIDWCCRRHGIPRRLIPSEYVHAARRWSPTDRPGLGYHSMFLFVDPVNKVGPLPLSSESWTYAHAKTCPGRTRTRQFLDIVLPRVVTLGTVIPDPEVPPMSAREHVYQDPTIIDGYQQGDGSTDRRPRTIVANPDTGRARVLTTASSISHALDVVPAEQVHTWPLYAYMATDLWDVSGDPTAPPRG